MIVQSEAPFVQAIVISHQLVRLLVLQADSMEQKQRCNLDGALQIDAPEAHVMLCTDEKVETQQQHTTRCEFAPPKNLRHLCIKRRLKDFLGENQSKRSSHSAAAVVC